MRYMLFSFTNMAVIAVMTVVFKITGLDEALGAYGMNMVSLLVMSFIMGMLGSLISLMMSKSSAIRSTRARVIDTPQNEQEQWLLDTVTRQASQAGIGMPDVAIFDSPDVNAFATGARKDSALVAVSTGLLRAMSREEAEAVMAHEVSHVANGDMVTMTLLQGVVNTFVIFLSRIIGRMVSSLMSRNSRSGVMGGLGGMGYYLSVMVCQAVFGFLATIIVRYFSRAREFRADEGGARLAGRQNMINALARLKGAHEPSAMPDQLQAFGILGLKAKMGKLFMSHPPLDNRIASLKRND